MYVVFQYAELSSRGNFSREDILTVLTANHGDLETAYTELNKNAVQPFLMRVWGSPVGTENEEGNIVIGSQKSDVSLSGEVTNIISNLC